MVKYYLEKYFNDNKMNVKLSFFSFQTIDIRLFISGVTKTIKHMVFLKKLFTYKNIIQKYLFTKKRKTLTGTCLPLDQYVMRTCLSTRPGRIMILYYVIWSQPYMIMILGDITRYRGLSQNLSSPHLTLGSWGIPSPSCYWCCDSYIDKIRHVLTFLIPLLATVILNRKFEKKILCYFCNEVCYVIYIATHRR